MKKLIAMIVVGMMSSVAFAESHNDASNANTDSTTTQKTVVQKKKKSHKMKKGHHNNKDKSKDKAPGDQTPPADTTGTPPANDMGENKPE